MADRRRGSAAWQLGPPVRSGQRRSATLGFRDYSHSVFEVFQAPRSGDFTSAHIFRYRSFMATPPPAGRVLARYDDGAVALAERRTGAGRVIVWTSTLDDSWTDLAKEADIPPLVHQLVRYLARYEQPPSWLTSARLSTSIHRRADSGATESSSPPSGQRTTQRANAPGLLELTSRGV